jgi:hypothetical protein
LKAILAFGQRALGSVAYGIGAIFGSDAPGERLAALEAQGKVLSWATMLVAASALFSVLWPAAFIRTDASVNDWVLAMLELPRMSGALERLVPTLCVGLIVCFFARLLGGSRLKRRHNYLLLASTLFGLTLLSALSSAALLRFAVGTDFAELQLAFEFGFARVVLLWACWLAAVPSVLCIACGFRTARSFLSLAPARSDSWWPRAGWVGVSILPGLAGFLFPLVLFYAVVATLSAGGPAISRLREDLPVEELAEFIPHEMNCSPTPGNAQELECLLVASTRGKGQVFMDASKPALLLDETAMRQETRFPFQRRSGTIDPDEWDASSMARVTRAEADIEFLALEHTTTHTVAVELGSPVKILVKLKLPQACGLLKRPLDSSAFIVVIRPLRSERESFNPFAILGPWSTSNLNLSAYCKAP